MYTAQAHFDLAARKGTRSKYLLAIVPSIVGGAAGLVAALYPPFALAGGIAALTGIVTAVAGFLGVEKDAIAHEVAARLLTQLRHEARSLRETHSPDMSAEEFAVHVRTLENRYSAFIASLPPTDDKAFARAQAKVKSGVFRYDAEGPALGPGATKAQPPGEAARDTRDSE